MKQAERMLRQLLNRNPTLEVSWLPAKATRITSREYGEKSHRSLCWRFIE